MQIVGYDTGAPPSDEAPGRDPALLLASDGSVDRRVLEPGAQVDYALGERRCAGAVDGDAHYDCDRPAAPYCDQHTSTWVCARCTGTCLKDEMDCYEAHAIYLAAFAPDLLKVGVTREWRLETRLREQGADRAAHLRTVENGRIARELEAEIATEIGDAVRVDRKVEGLGATVGEDWWDRQLAAFDPIETFEFDYGLDLRDRPVAETVATGTVRGTKGRVLLVDTAGTTYAVDMRDLVGYEVGEGGEDGRDLQSSLGAFG